MCETTRSDRQGMDMSEKSFEGYVCSAFGVQAVNRLRVAEAKSCQIQRGRARQKLTDSDILFFSGHHYARYSDPLKFDAIDLKEWRFVSKRVKLLMVSSCSALHPNAVDRFRRKFPNAYIFG